jgi:lipopolysaccharide heptosyltransferase II
VKALIVRLSSIGDVVHTLPVVAALRRHGWEAGWVVEPPARPLLPGEPFLQHVATAPAARRFGLGAARRVSRELQEQRYDVALDLQGLWKSALWARAAGAPRVVGYASPWRRERLSSLLVRELAEVPSDATHVIDKNLALLRVVGIDAVGFRHFPLPAPSEEQVTALGVRIHELGLRDFVILNPGGGWPSKLWPPERYGILARGLRDRGLRALVSWGPGEERLADRAVAVSDGAALKGFATSLTDLLELARRARLVVAADTGPLHLACAAMTPVVGIYGPTDPSRNGPYSPRDVVVRRTPLCSPCHKRRCPVHEGVMDVITPDEVLRAVDRRLGIAGAPAIAI